MTETNITNNLGNKTTSIETVGVDKVISSGCPIPGAGTADSEEAESKLTDENYTSNFLQFEKRQAGVNVVYSPDDSRFYYNAYCMETSLLKDLMSVEFEFLEDALTMINSDFGSWDLKDFDPKQKDCGSCSAK